MINSTRTARSVLQIMVVGPAALYLLSALSSLSLDGDLKIRNGPAYLPKVRAESVNRVVADLNSAADSGIVSATQQSMSSTYEVDRSVEKLLQSAARDISAMRLTTPHRNNAKEKYRTILQLQPGCSEAIKGLENIVSIYLAMSRASVREGKFLQARTYLNRARDVRVF